MHIFAVQFEVQFAFSCTGNSLELHSLIIINIIVSIYCVNGVLLPFQHAGQCWRCACWIPLHIVLRGLASQHQRQCHPCTEYQSLCYRIQVKYTKCYTVTIFRNLIESLFNFNDQVPKLFSPAVFYCFHCILNLKHSTIRWEGRGWQVILLKEGKGNCFSLAQCDILQCERYNNMVSLVWTLMWVCDGMKMKALNYRYDKRSW